MIPAKLTKRSGLSILILFSMLAAALLQSGPAFAQEGGEQNTPTPTFTPTLTPTLTPTATPTATEEQAQAQDEPDPAGQPTLTPSATPEPAPTDTPAQAPSATPPGAPTETPAPGDTPTPEASPTAETSASPTATEAAEIVPLLMPEDTRNIIPGQYIVVYKESKGDVKSMRAGRDKVKEKGGEIKASFSHAIKGFSAKLSEAALHELRTNPDIAYIEPDQYVYAIDEGVGEMSTQDTSGSPGLWGLDRIDQVDLPLDDAYHYPTAAGAGVHVYVLDSGIRASHTEFSGRILNGYDFVDDDDSPNEGTGHGTMVASVIGGTTAGVAKEVYIHALRVLNNLGKGSASDIVAALNWVITNHSDPAVVNMSLGANYIISSLNTAVANTVAAGITVVVSSGNIEDGVVDACDWSPASAPSALTVGAINDEDERAYYSTYGACLDLFAPGDGVLVADYSDDINFLLGYGTSFSSPMVAGAAALYLADNPGAAPAQVAAALLEQATNDTLTGVGSGSPNLLLAVFSNEVPQITLSSPADGYETNQTALTLSWNAGYIGNTYELQVDDSDAFGSLFYTTTTESLSAPVSSLTVGTWYWRVRATNPYGTIGEWSAARSLIIDQTPPDAPLLSTPADGVYNVGTPAFAWSAPATAVYYQFEYSTVNNDPDNNYVYRSGELSAPSHTPPSMAQETQYYWFARARDAAGNWSVWSAPFSIMIVPAAPGGPGLTSPANGAIGNDDTPQLTWAEVSDVSYHVQISTESDFDPLAQQADNLTEESFSAAHLEDGKYYWRVRCKSEYGIYGGWSSLRYFTIDTLSPSAPTLLSPVSGAKAYVVPSFYWNAVSGAAAYQFAYSLSDDPAAAIYLSGEIAAPTTYHTPSVKTRDMTYYWFVRARDTAGNWSAWSSSNFLTILANIPAKAVLSAPANGSLTNDDTPDLAWSLLPDCEYYHLQISSISNFTVIVQEQDDLTGTSSTPAALADGKYYWRVRGRNNESDYGAWSAARYFYVDDAPPDAPAQISPAAGANVSGTPTFMWSRPSGAKYYQFRYADADAPETILYLSAETTRYTLKPPAMEVMNTYNWSARARDAAGNWSDWSAPSEVTILPPLPARPLLTSPASAAEVNPALTTLELQWGAVNYAVSYQIQISRASSFADIYLMEDVSGLTELSYTPGALDPALYYWRVRGRNANGGDGSWSSPRYFRIDTIPPAAPTLYYPKDAVQFSGTPKFQWLRPSGGVYFEFQYGTSSDPGSFVYNSGQTSNNTHIPPEMGTNTLFYWYVRARDKAGNWGAWSTPRTITILPPVPAKPVLSTPGNGTSGNDPTPDFSWGAVNYAAEYEIQISTSSRFYAPYLYLEDTNVPSATFTPAADLPEGRYYWRVRAKNENDTAGGWSSYRYFTVDTSAPPAPALRSPADNSSLTTATPAFSWYAASGGRYYQLAYGTENDPEAALFTSGWSTSTALKVTAMDFLTPYYWFVRSQDLAGNIGAWSSGRLVTILPPTPGRPSLALPAKASVTDETEIDLSWSAVTYGNTYEVQIDDYSGFSSVNYAYTSAVETPALTTGTLAAGKWYWRARACNENDVCGSWSYASYFTIYPKFDTQFNTDGDSEGWQTSSGATWAAASGALSTAGLTGGRSSSASYSDVNFSDFTYTAAMKMDAPASGEANTYGVVLRGTPAFNVWNDWNNGIYFTVRQVNDAGLGTQYACALAYRISAGSWTYLGGSCGQAQYDDWNELTVYAKGSAFKFYMNGYLVLSKSVSVASSGRLGVVSWSQGAADSYVDWAAVGAPLEPEALGLSAQSALPFEIDPREVFEQMQK